MRRLISTHWKNYLRFFLCFALLLVTTHTLHATHIVGAELYYECVDPVNFRYRVTLRMFRDCLTGEAPFDDEISLFVFRSQGGALDRIVEIPRPPVTPELDPEGWDVCTGRTYNLCIEEGVYSTFITLPPIPGGYDLGWARCCRNANITNLFNPLAQGVTFSAHVTGTEVPGCNNMAIFNNTLPTFICASETFLFDHSATDADGDSLVYTLSNPNNGLNFMGLGASNNQGGNRPPVVNQTNPLGPPPYQTVSYSGGGFNSQNPFGPNTATIDPQTGWLTFSPPQVGVYVVAISVIEYRNGVAIAENKKDFQIHVVPCLPMNDPPVISHDFGNQPSSGDTIIVNALDTTCYTVTVTDTNLQDSLVAQLLSATFSSGAPRPTVTFTGNNPMLIDVCWIPGCQYANQTVELIIAASDINDCPNHNNVFDSVYINILPPPPVQPVVGYDISSAPSVADTIILEVDSSMCFDWWVTDTLGHNLSWAIQVDEIGGGGGFTPQLSATNFPDSIAISTCWTAGCDERGRLFRIILEGTDETVCPPDNNDRDTLYLRVLPIPNPPPVVSHDLSGNVFNQDTIFIDVHDTLCYTFVLNDTFPAVNLTYTIRAENLNGTPAIGPPPTLTVISQTDSIVGQICWEPNCDNVNGIFRLILTGLQENKCRETAPAFDTVYVQVNDLFNPPPQIAHTFRPGFRFNGDTLFIAADSVVCYDFSLRDSVFRSHLRIQPEIRFASNGNLTTHTANLNLTTQLDTLLEGELCFLPGCSYLGELLEVVLTGVDTFDCQLSNWVYDTVYIQVEAPFNQPPVLTTDLSGLELEGNTVLVEAGVESCYTLTLSDPDGIEAELIASGTTPIFNSDFGYGNPAQLTLEGENPLIITVCWNPSCHEEEEEFLLKVCGRDTSRCDHLPDVCDSVLFRVKPCTIVTQNVFTPNGDGNNDDFIPFDLQGVEWYTMQIFDRWGVKVNESTNATWDGTVNNRQGQAGVYYYIVEYQFFSADGPPLRDFITGWVALVR